MQVQNGTIPVFGLISAQTQPQAGGGIDIMTILLFVLLGLFVFMMFRRNKKTQQQQAQLQSKFEPGVEVMTSFGLSHNAGGATNAGTDEHQMRPTRRTERRCAGRLLTRSRCGRPGPGG